MTTEPFDIVDRPYHYNTGRFTHSLCGKPIEVIDITRRLGFDDGNAVKYILRSGHKHNLLEDLRKARWYLADLIAQLEAELETTEILSDPETVAAIRAGDEDLAARQAWGPGTTLSVQYVPAGFNDPWGPRTWTEYVTGSESVAEVKRLAVGQLGFGNPDGFELWGSPLPELENALLPGDLVLRDILRPGTVLWLARIQPEPVTQGTDPYAGQTLMTASPDRVQL